MSWVWLCVLVALALVWARTGWRSESVARTAVRDQRVRTPRRAAPTPRQQVQLPHRRQAGRHSGRRPRRVVGRAADRRQRGSNPAATYRRTDGWARWLDREDVLVIDTETTGTGRRDEVLSIAVIDTTGRTRFSELVMPLGRISAAATAKHGLTRARLEAAGARGWPHHHERVALLIAEAAEVLAYNAAFDLRLLQQTAALFGRSLPQTHWTCVMNRRRSEGRSGSLTAAAKAEGVPVAGTHEALADARTTLEVIRAMAAREQATVNRPDVLEPRPSEDAEQLRREYKQQAELQDQHDELPAAANLPSAGALIRDCPLCDAPMVATATGGLSCTNSCCIAGAPSDDKRDGRDAYRRIRP